MEHLTIKPDVHSYKDKSQRMDVRLTLAHKLLRPLLDSLHPILIVSIILFIAGLMFQLWSISFSAGESPVLILTSALGSVLIIGLAVVAATSLAHGVYREESPFTTSTTTGIRQLLSSRLIKSVPSVSDNIYPLFCSVVKQMSETHHFDQVSSVPFEDLLASQEDEKIRLVVDTVVSVLESDASWKAKQTVARNLCSSGWSIERADRKDAETLLKSHRRLHDALGAANSDVPSSQSKVELTLYMAKLVVFLKFSGVNIDLFILESIKVKEAIIAIFKLNPKECIDEEILRGERLIALAACEDLEKKEPHLFDDVKNNFVSVIVREVIDVNDWWKLSICRFLSQERSTIFLNVISTESQEGSVDSFHLFRILSGVLYFCNLPIIFPHTFDISNLVKFATINERRFHADDFTPHSPVNVLLFCLSLVDDDFFDDEKLFSDFLNSLDGHEERIQSIRDEIKLTSAVVVELRNRIALSGESMYCFLHQLF